MNRLQLKCSWCETVDIFEGDLTEDDALAAGWFLIQTADGEVEFCSRECLISFL